MDAAGDAWTIYYDDLQEGAWFQDLDSRLDDADLRPLKEALEDPALAPVLSLDRPDILLAHHGVAVLVVERTIEVPSGHNVGQRFARLAAAAERQVPLVYFGPFKARKHGGSTEGPRYMNLRLFYALDKIEEINEAAVSTINWPVDDDCEIIRAPEKDDQMRRYLSTLMDIILADDDRQGLIVEHIRETEIYAELRADRLHFENNGVTNPEQYLLPPDSLRHLTGADAAAEFGAPGLAQKEMVAAYRVGMTKWRADPYTGSGILYRYLYVLPFTRQRALVLEFPHIPFSEWQVRARRATIGKDIKLYRIAADGIMFQDGFQPREEL